MKTQAASVSREAKLRVIFCQMDADEYAAIRDAYYKAAEGLNALDSLLCEAEDLGMDNTALTGEKHHVSEARKQFNRCGLGVIL